MNCAEAEPHFGKGAENKHQKATRTISYAIVCEGTFRMPNSSASSFPKHLIPSRQWEGTETPVRAQQSPNLRDMGAQATLATHSISTSQNFGNAATCTAARAGRWSPK